MTSDSLEVRRVLRAILVKMTEPSLGIFTAKDIGFTLTGVSGLRPLFIPEVIDLIAELNVKVSESEFKGQPNLLFLQFGKYIRVKTGIMSATSAESILFSNL